MFVNFTISLRVYTRVGSVRIAFINQEYFQDKAIEWGSTFDQTLVSFARSTGIDLVSVPQWGSNSRVSEKWQVLYENGREFLDLV